MLLADARAEVAAAARRLVVDRLVTGTSGNVSLREPESGLVALTPSGLSYDDLEAADVVVVDAGGQTVEGRWQPSSELPMHLALYRGRPDASAIVHTHSPFATAFAVTRRPIPAVHYEVVTMGSSIRVAPYATYGTEALAENALATMGRDNAVLLQNHGVLAVGPTLAKAYAFAQKVEYLAELYYRALQVGQPNILSESQLAEVRTQFQTYGPVKPPARSR